MIRKLYADEVRLIAAALDAFGGKSAKVLADEVRSSRITINVRRKAKGFVLYETGEVASMKMLREDLARQLRYRVRESRKYVAEMDDAEVVDLLKTMDTEYQFVAQLPKGAKVNEWGSHRKTGPAYLDTPTQERLYCAMLLPWMRSANSMSLELATECSAASCRKFVVVQSDGSGVVVFGNGSYVSPNRASPLFAMLARFMAGVHPEGIRGDKLDPNTSDPRNPSRHDIEESLREAETIFGGRGRSPVLWLLSDDKTHSKVEIARALEGSGWSEPNWKDPAQRAINVLLREEMIEPDGDGWRLRTDLPGRDAFLRFCAEVKSLGKKLNAKKPK